MTKDLPTYDDMSKLFLYDPETGALRNRLARSTARAGDEAGCVNGHGYRQVSVNGKLYYVHRIVWLLYHGVWPGGQIDHINRDKLDNRIANLRDVTHRENKQNLDPSANNTTGFLGVSRRLGRFQARINSRGAKYYGGTYDTAEEAHAAYLRLKAKYHTFKHRKTET